MVDTDTGPTDCKKPHSCIELSILTPRATGKVPSVVRCKCSLGGNDTILTMQDGALSVHIAVLPNSDSQAIHTTHVW